MPRSAAPFSAHPARWSMSTDALALMASLLFAFACNTAFWREALAGRVPSQPATWGFAAAVCVALVAAHFLLLGLVLQRHIAKPLLSVLIVATAFAVYYTNKFNVFLDPSMLRNVLRTDVKEASELFTWALLPHLLLYAALPLLVLWRLPLQHRPWPRALAKRLGWMLLALLLGVGGVLAVFKDFSALMRNHKELRYLITPANFLYSLARVTVADTRTAARPKEAIGTDATLAPSWAARRKPVLVLFVLGETARAANWGLSGYGRQTTPELAKVDGLINFNQVGSCGTNTEVSVPCLFSPWGRRQYDEDRIRGSQSLLHVLDRAGLGVFWRDNQSGCKGVCDGLPNEQLHADSGNALCDGERCLDEALIDGLDKLLLPGALAAAAPGASAASGSASAPARAAATGPAAKMAGQSRFIVLHQLGNHGPSYFKRYPPDFKRFTPTCDTADLRLCTPEQVVNTYDNALLYTDHVLAGAVAFLKRHAATHDTALVYVSDHGESLGENQLYLHGIPYAIAPKEQTQVPMVMWFSPELAASNGVDLACLRQRAGQAASHDNLFHSMLGLMAVDTQVRDATMDLFQACRKAH